MPTQPVPYRRCLVAGLLGTAAWLALPNPAAAQACNMFMLGGVKTCTYSGTGSTWGFQTGNIDAPPMLVTSHGYIIMYVKTDEAVGLNFGSFGATENSGRGGNVQGLQLTNAGSITLYEDSTTGGQTYGIQAVQTAGNGDPGGSSIGVNGSRVPAGVTINNAGPVTVTLNSIQVGGGAGIWGADTGGDGLNGGSGGSSAGVSITSGGAVNADVNITSTGFAGILAQSAGGNGYIVGNDVGIGGAAGPATVTLTQGGDVTLQLNGTPPSALGVSGGVLATAVGGLGGGNSSNGQNAGDGGAVAGASVSATDASVSTIGVNLPGIVAFAQGGNGGQGGSLDSLGVSLHAGQGGGGGAVNGSAAVTLTGSSPSGPTGATTGNNSPGVYALSLGGQGGDGGYLNPALGEGTAGYGGAGGDTGAVTVSLVSASINTSGTSSPGIIAQSEGGGGGDGNGSGGVGEIYGGNGGNGGSAGTVTVMLDSASTIQTSQSGSVGILAQSLGGAAGEGGEGLEEHGGTGGIGGNSDTVSVTNGGSITTSGQTAHGIVAQSLAGGGGSGGSSWSLFHSSGGSGSAGGTSGEVDVTNTGSITTNGSNAHGALLQSIGGGGGAGGGAGGPISNVGGSGSFAADGSTVNFTASGGNITTNGISAIGVLGQSIGGGGGDGGGSEGVAVTIGGQGGVAGSGGAVTGTLNPGAAISTTGDLAAAVVMQSIGGGGGNGGNASSDGLFATVAIGGNAGDGSVGGTVNLNATGATITTAGSHSQGLVAQSIGGGGGTGGASLSGSIGAGFSSSVAIGGTGGSGTDGGAVTVTLADTTISTGQNSILVNGSGSTIPVPCTQTPSQSQANSSPCNGLPVDSFGVVVQSIGGGGGLGGSATAQSIAVSTPVTGEGDQVALAISVGVGGKGKGGGDGGAVQFSLSNGSTITTYGQGSAGALIQSVGGGGGAGGDSSASAAAVGFPQTLPDNKDGPGGTVAFSVGGTGGGAGNGGTVQVALSGTVGSNGPVADASGTTSITTYGDFADGIVAQSIGGGGGNAGSGAGNTQDFGTGTTTSFSFVLGSQGGTSGNGGAVTVDTFSGNSIATHGSGAIGIVAQSIGGGGGSSQGGSMSVAQSFKPNSGSGEGGANPTIKPGLSVQLGIQGSGGGYADTVTVNADAPITTLGGDAVGILAQSIGGGGGLGGSAGSDASGDNPFVAALNGREWQSDVNNYITDGSTPSYDPTLALAIGGTGGTGGNGDTVLVTLGAQIATLGTWASGIIAQSVGGGGGKGGTAVATGTGGSAEVTINLQHAIGGSGGAGGDGGSATVELDEGSSVSTGGVGAAGIVVQSIGGGGGVGTDGSDSATGDISVGGTTDGKGGSGGNGGSAAVTLTNSSTVTIATTNAVADGVVLQSIGGGGGIGGTGNERWGQNLGTPESGALALTVGGGSGASGNGGSATFASSSAGNPVTISTTGYDAYGILAQSIGGGGGVISTNPISSSMSYTIGGKGSGDGNAVSVYLPAGSGITTTGMAAHGIVAQSIGGGGGVIRVVQWWQDTPTLSTSVGNWLTTEKGSGNGGDVTVQTAENAPISVSGPGSIGILAQSIGGGGGFVAQNGDMFAGSVNPTASYTTGNVDVTANSSVSATGQGGIGIFAQGTGTTSSTGRVDVVINNYDNQGVTVSGGTGSGSAGVWVDTPANSPTASVTNDLATITTADGSNGTAITVTGGGQIAVTNNSGNIDGTITGSIYTNGGQINGSGTFNAGPMMEAADVVTSGTFNLGLPGELRATRVTGNFVQTGEGRLGVTVDSLNRTAGHLQVDGTATLDGQIVPTVLTLLPGALPVVTAGHLTSTADGLDALLFHWDTAQSGNTLTLAPRSDFKPGGVALNDSQASLAGYYGRAWDNGDKAFATRFAQLSTINDRSDYKAALDAWSSKAAHAQSIALANSAGTILGAAMSCPVFIDDSVLLGEDNCAWAKVTGRWTDQSATSDTQGYYVSGTTYRIGAQHEIAPDWYLGASFGFGQSWARMDGGSSGNGDTYDGSVTVKRVMGPWQFAGSVAFAGGSFEADRRVDIPGIASETLKSDPSIFLAGGRLRAAYEFAFEDWYIRPYGDLDVVYTDLPGFQEKGDDLYALDVRGSSKTSVALSPMVEFGGRLDLDTETALRAYVAFGMSYQPDNTRTIHSSFAGASSANGTFSDHIDSPDVLGRIDVGVQLFRAGGFELKGEYTADIGGSFLSQSASARAAYHF
ncbi:hypothetical protein [Inquilinus ginsengisoli]|uniref:hypothetical protein n=1 Tax=Inquilinus ginsengisoli TaxID=363840 RepID=UPI003D1E0FD4